MHAFTLCSDRKHICARKKEKNTPYRMAAHRFGNSPDVPSKGGVVIWCCPENVSFAPRGKSVFCIGSKFFPNIPWE
jgi:hypothetical protein